MNVIHGLDLPNDLVAAYVLDIRPGITGITVAPPSDDYPTPVGIKEWFGTSVIDGEPTKTISQRLTRCNELTNYAMLAGDAPIYAHLVHGSIDGTGRIEGATQRIQHSWLLIPARRATLVWEPITASLMMKDEWYEFARAWDEREYARSLVVSNTNQSGHYGPWHESRYP